MEAASSGHRPSGIRLRCYTRIARRPVCAADARDNTALIPSLSVEAKDAADAQKSIADLLLEPDPPDDTPPPPSGEGGGTDEVSAVEQPADLRRGRTPSVTSRMTWRVVSNSTLAMTSTV